MSEKKAQKKNPAPAAATKEAAAAPAAADPAKKAKKKKPATSAPAEDEWTLVTGRRRNGRKWPDGKKIKKGEDAEPHKDHQEATGFNRNQLSHPKNRRPHVPVEIVPCEHSKEVVKVVLFVTNEAEEEALRLALEGRPYEILAVATMESVAHFEKPESIKSKRLLSNVEDVRAMMKELGIVLFVLPVDDSLLPGPRMTDEVSTFLDVAVRAGAYALTISITPIDASCAKGSVFFAAVPTHESKQLLINTLGVVDDEKVRQDFEIHGFDVPEKAGLLDVYTSLINSAVKKFKGEADILPTGDQLIQDVASRATKTVHYPVFTMSFMAGKLQYYKRNEQLVYEIYSDDVTPDPLKNIFILVGENIHKKLSIIVNKYQKGPVKTDIEDPEKRIDVEFEKIMFSYSSPLTETPLFELYLPRYVDPTAATPAAEAPKAEEAKTEEPAK